MSIESSRRVRQAAAGAVLGGLIAIGIEQLGIPALFKLDVSLLLPLILIGGALALTRIGALVWLAAGAVVLSVAVISYTALASDLIEPLVRRDSLPPMLDAVVVLSGGTTADQMMVSATLDRLLTGAELAREGRTRALVLSREEWVRGGRALSDSIDQSNVIRLARIPVPIFFIDSATSTRTEALLARNLSVGKHWSEIGVVTSPPHTRRACATFERLGFKVTCIPSAYREGALQHLDGPGDRLSAFQAWLYEMAGTLRYRQAGWIK